MSRTLYFTLTFLLLSSCSSVDTSRNTLDEYPENSQPSMPAYDARLENLLVEASRLPSPEAESLYLEAASILLSRGYPGEATTILSLIQTTGLPRTLRTEVLLIRAQILIDSNRPTEAIPILSSDEFTSLAQLPLDLQRQVRRLKAESYQAGELYLLSAQERIELDSSLPSEQKAANHQLIWQSLNALTIEHLQELSSQSIAYEFQGWYQLALLGKTYQFDPDRQLVELEDWLSRWGRHPAAIQLPEPLHSITQLIEYRPSKIALLLPLQSTAGKVIRDGFMSAYYSASQSGLAVPELSFYDTSNQSALQLHTLAREDGAQLVIGPLLKPQVELFKNRRNLDIPTLALNTLESGRGGSSNFYQFALSPENEVTQIAQRAWDSGYRNAAILSPFETNNDYYTRKRETFRAHWSSLGGSISAEEMFSRDYTTVIESLLNLSKSNQRREDIESILNTQVEFTPRRRQDIDFIFLIADPRAARQINPSLSYLYAGDIPVIATQDVYSGRPQPQLDADLNGIVFNDTPWLLDINSEFKEKTLTLFPQSSATLLRLQAFGVDIFRLYPRLQQLENNNTLLYGVTGQLNMDDNRIITQRYGWAKIQQGLAQPIQGIP